MKKVVGKLTENSGRHWLMFRRADGKFGASLAAVQVGSFRFAPALRDFTDKFTRYQFQERIS